LLCTLLVLAVQAFFKSENIVPISVNYHFTSKCNRECGFCFHTEKVNFVALSIVSTVQA